MDDAEREGMGSDAEDLVLCTIAVHADSLLRTARRHSLCADDAQDAYQRSLEIFMRHAARLDRARAGAWLHTVVKHEAMAIRRSRRQLVGVEDAELEEQRAGGAPTPEDQLLAFDMVGRSAEALKRLKPQELRALWLKAQGFSYSDIGEITGWTYTNMWSDACRPVEWRRSERHMVRAVSGDVDALDRRNVETILKIAG